MLMQLYNLEIVWIDCFLKFLHLFLQIMKPGSIKFLTDLFNEERGKFELKFSLGSFKISHVLFKYFLEVCFHVINFWFESILEFVRTFLEFFDKLLIV